MPNSFFGLTIGTTGLYSSNVGINTTAHNISNTETEGFSRQVVKQRAGDPLRAYGTYGMIGTGSEVTGIEQERNEYYDVKYRSNNTLTGYYDAQKYYMDSVENYFNEIQLEGFNTTFNQFYDALQELSKNPSSGNVRTQVNSYAQSFCEFINSLSISMEKLQENANFEVKTMVDSVNSLAVQIAGLTQQINTLEVTGGKANDLRDQRALLVDELSNIADISVTENVVGVASAGVTSYTVKLGESTLVDTFEYNLMKVVPRPDKQNQSDIDGLYEIQWETGQTYNALAGGGRLQALMEVRDGNNGQSFSGISTANYGDEVIQVTGTAYNDVNQLHINETGVINIGNREYTYNGFQVTTDDDGNYVYEFALDEPLRKDIDDIDVSIGKPIEYKGITYYMQQLNEFARTFSKKFNDIHKEGRDLSNEQGMDYFNAKHKVSGDNYVFESSPENEDDGILFTTKTGYYAVEEEEKNYGSYYFMTADNIGVTEEIYADPNKIAASSDIVNGVEQNDIALKLIALKEDETMFKQGTPSGFLQALIAELGVDSSKATKFSQNQQNIRATVQNQRLSVSGVDMEEEGMNLIRYQNCYNLSAKVISTMNEMYYKLINEMGM